MSRLERGKIVDQTPAELLDEHEHCKDGECGHCEGSGEVECTCTDCGNDHERDCDHCDATGKCEVDVGKIKAARDRAFDEWDEFRNRYSFPPNRTGFCDNWRKMYGTDPPVSALMDFIALAQRLADAAGVEWHASK